MSLLLPMALAFLSNCGHQNADKTESASELSHADTSSLPVPAPTSHRSMPTPDDVSYFKSELEGQFRNYEYLNVNDTIHADLNGDGALDEAIFTIENGSEGILISHGETDETIKIGLGHGLEEMTDFDWVDYWALIRDSSTYEIVIEDDQIVGDTTIRLSQPSIAVRKSEVGGGVITFHNGQYIWIHQAD